MHWHLPLIERAATNQVHPFVRQAGYTSKWIRPHSLLLTDSSGLISPDEADLFRAVAQAVTDGLPVIRPEPDLRGGCDSILRSSSSTAVLGMVARQKLFFGVACLAVTASTGKGGEGSVVLWSRAMCSLHEVNR